MNKRQKKKRLKMNPRPCPICGSKVKVEDWGSWHQIGCWSYSCHYGVFVVAKRKKDAIKGWNRLIEEYFSQEEEK